MLLLFLIKTFAFVLFNPKNVMYPILISSLKTLLEALWLPKEYSYEYLRRGGGAVKKIRKNNHCMLRFWLFVRYINILYDKSFHISSILNNTYRIVICCNYFMNTISIKFNQAKKTPFFQMHHICMWKI